LQSNQNNMEIKTIKQTKNPFMKREELTLEITSESVPSTSEVISKLGKDEALTVIKKINTNFGRQTFLTEVVVYDNIEARKKIETIPQKIRKKMAAEEKAAAEEAKKKADAEIKEADAAAEAAKQEAEAPVAEENPVEEVKDEEKGSAPTDNKDKSVRVTE